MPHLPPVHIEPQTGAVRLHGRHVGWLVPHDPRGDLWVPHPVDGAPGAPAEWYDAFAALVATLDDARRVA